MRTAMSPASVPAAVAHGGTVDVAGQGFAAVSRARREAVRAVTDRPRVVHDACSTGDATSMSRKVRLFIATSLDGHIAGPGGSLDWLFADDDYGYDAFIAEVDTLAMGRKTYEVVKSLGDWPYDAQISWVFTRQERPARDPHVNFTSKSPADWLHEIELLPGKDIWVVGGGELIRDFLDARLVDEMTIAVHPVVLGGGTPLFPQGSPRHKLRLAHVHSYPSGLVSSTYMVQT